MSKIKKIGQAGKTMAASGRRCSVCFTAGHNKLNCPAAEAKAWRQAHIPVKSSDKQPVRSAYVVTLGNYGARKKENLPVFSEFIISKSERSVVDFGALVRKANQSVLQTRVDDVDEEEPVLVFIEKKQKEILFLRIAASCKEIKSRFNPRSFAASIAILAVLFLVPYPAFSYYQKLRGDTDYVVEESVNAFLSLQSSTAAVLATNIPQAESDLNMALNSFSKAEAVVEKEHRALVYIASALPFVGKKVASREHILSAGHAVALGNAYLVKGIGEASASSTKMDFLDRLAILKVHVRGALPQYEDALAELALVKTETLPLEYQQSFSEFKVLFAALSRDLKNMASVMAGFEHILGADSPRRYLIVFQNHHELRPTGGFIGSLAILDVQRGKIMNIEVPVGGSYDFQGQLDTYVKPPLPLQIANARWEFQDANWFPDFPASAEKIAWFYRHSRGSTVDGVIAVNGSVLERILKVLGPIGNDEYGLQLSATDALETLQTEVETGSEKAENRPKAVIGSVFRQLLDSASAVNTLQTVSLVAEMGTALQNKEIQIYVADEKTQKKFFELGWTGEIATIAPTHDYLMVVNTNLGGAKTDARVSDAVEHQAVVQSDGSVIDTVIIRRKHSGIRGDALYGRPNSSYVRVYAPKGSELVAASGFIYPEEEFFKVPESWYKEDSDLKANEIERGFHVGSGTRITDEFGKTVFGNWITTLPGEETEVWFTYKLPFTAGIAKAGSATSRYTLMVQKQSGTKTEFSTQIIYPEGWSPVWFSRDDLQIGTNGMRWSDTLAGDELFGLVLRYNKIRNF